MNAIMGQEFEKQVAVASLGRADIETLRMINRAIGAMPPGLERDRQEREFTAALIILRTRNHSNSP